MIFLDVNIKINTWPLAFALVLIALMLLASLKSKSAGKRKKSVGSTWKPARPRERELTKTEKSRLKNNPKPNNLADIR